MRRIHLQPKRALVLITCALLMQPATAAPVVFSTGFGIRWCAVQIFDKSLDAAAGVSHNLAVSVQQKQEQQQFNDARSRKALSL